MTTPRARGATVPEMKSEPVSLLSISSDKLLVRSPEQRRFEQALNGRSTKIDTLRRTLRRAVKPWGGLATAEIIKATIFHCGLYYCACLPDAAPRRSRAKLKGDITKAANLAGRLAPALRRVWNSRNPTVRHWLAPVADTQFHAGDGLATGGPLDPGLLRVIDEVWRRLALLDQALPADIGGTRKALAFIDLANWLAGIYCQVAGIQSAPTATTGDFFRYIAAVVDLLGAVAVRFPKAEFDFPSNDEALRKALARIASRRTQPGS
jgi:hypothetical protein